MIQLIQLIQLIRAIRAIRLVSSLPDSAGVVAAAGCALLTCRFGPGLCGYSEQVARLPIAFTTLVAFAVFVGRGHDLRRVSLLLCALVFSAMPLLSVRALAGLHVGSPGYVDEIGQLVTDPSPIPGGGVLVTLRLDGKRLRSVAYGDAGRTLALGSAGSRYGIVGRTQQWDGAIPGWAVSKHLAGRVTVKSATLVDHGSVLWRSARWIRGQVARGAYGLPPDQRALFGGFVLGDDRGQDPAVADDFRASGLAHLLVVSGQNVAFLLTAANPLLRRMPSILRAATAIMVIAGFALITRFEPSVLRAATMAALVVLARAANRPQAALRVLSLAVIGLLVIDPLLAWSLGFGLSVCATTGLAVLAAPLETRLAERRVPAWLARPLAATLAAQIGTYPLLLGLGGVSPVSVLANLLALPAAEPLMIWGVVIGVPAGVLGGRAAVILHLVDRVLIWWVASVARGGGNIARLFPLPVWWPLAGIVCVGAIWLLTRASLPLARAVGVAVAVVILVTGTRIAPGLSGVHRQPALAGTALGGTTAALWRSAPAADQVTILAVRPGTNGESVLRSLRAAGVNNLSAVVIDRPTNALWTALAPVLSRHRTAMIILCGATSNLGSTPIVGLGVDDIVHVRPGGQPWVVVTCQSGHGVVTLESGPEALSAPAAG